MQWKLRKRSMGRRQDHSGASREAKGWWGGGEFPFTDKLLTVAASRGVMERGGACVCAPKKGGVKTVLLRIDVEGGQGKGRTSLLEGAHRPLQLLPLPSHRLLPPPGEVYHRRLCCVCTSVKAGGSAAGEPELSAALGWGGGCPSTESVVGWAMVGESSGAEAAGGG